MNKDQPGDSKSNWQFWKNENWRDLVTKFSYLNALLIIQIFCVILFSIILLFDICEPWKSLLLGTNGSLIASIIVTIVFKKHEKYALQSVQEAFIEESVKILEPRVSELTENALNRIQDTSNNLSLKINYLPDKVFESSSSSSVAFEKHIASNIIGSRRIVFKGVSALIHANRLMLLLKDGKLNFENKIQILLLNPKNDALLRSHESFRLHYTEGNTKNIIERAEELKAEILTVTLKLCQFTNDNYCNLDIRFHDELAVSRVEIFDNGIYLSYYNRGQPYPGTQYFNSSSEVYKPYNTNLEYYFNQKVTKFSLNNLSGNDKFESAVQTLEIDPVYARRLLLNFDNLVSSKVTGHKPA